MEELMIVPVMCACVTGFAVLVGFFAYLRFLRYKETIAMAEKGLVDVRANSPANGKGTLRWGIVITLLGSAFCLGLYPLGFINDLRGVFPLNFGPWMVIGLVPTFFGLALIVIAQLSNRKTDEVEPAADEPAELPEDDFPELEA